MGASGEQEFPKKRATKCGFYEEVMLVDKTLTGITKIIELRVPCRIYKLPYYVIIVVALPLVASKMSRIQYAGRRVPYGRPGWNRRDQRPDTWHLKPSTIQQFV
jgi:hypothetical protein